MAIIGLPQPLVGIIEQQGYLEKKFEDFLSADLVYRALADREPVGVRNGESVTKSRPGLKPVIFNDLNPSNNTGLDNGLTASGAPFEQYTLYVGMVADTINLDIEQTQARIADEYLLNWKIAAEQAARTLDTKCAAALHVAYGAGETFFTAAGSAVTTAHVDNVNGFLTAFNSTTGNSPGLATAVGGSNTLAASIIPAGGGTAVTVTITAVSSDPTNTSTMGAYGASGTVTFSAAQTFNSHDKLQAVDGAVVLRPGTVNTRAGLTSASTISLPLIASAVAKLRGRGVKPMRKNGMFACVVDPLVMAQLQSDPAFQSASRGGLETMRVFKTGYINEMLGVEFVSSNMVPSYQIPSSQLIARRAVVIGEGALVEGPFEGSLIAAKQQENGMSISDVRVSKDIVMLTRPGMSRLGTDIAQTWKWTGGHAAPTDVTSNPTTIPGSDYARNKRAIEIEVASNL